MSGRIFLLIVALLLALNKRLSPRDVRYRVNDKNSGVAFLFLL